MNLTISIGIVSLLSIAGQLVNLYLNLKLRTSVLEMKEEIRREVAEDYVRKDVLEALLGGRRHA